MGSPLVLSRNPKSFYNLKQLDFWTTDQKLWLERRTTYREIEKFMVLADEINIAASEEKNETYVFLKWLAPTNANLIFILTYSHFSNYGIS